MQITRDVVRPIFVVGPGRSGTTLLRAVLSAHPRIAIAPETHFMERAVGTNATKAAPEDFEEFWRVYTSWVRFQDLGVDADRCRALVMQEPSPTFKNIFRAVLTAYRERAGKQRVGEKSPSHAYFIMTLLDWFPEGQVLILQRDPRAVVASQLKTYYVRKQLTPVSLRRGVFMGNRLHQVAYYASDWNEIFERIVPTWHGDPRVHVVEYERLVQNPENELRVICEFLRERFEPAMLTTRAHNAVALPAGKASDPGLEAWRQEHQAKTLRPISAKSLEKWRHQLTETEVAIIEGQCRRGMRRTGYAFATSPAMRSGGRIVSHVLIKAEATETRARRLAKRTVQRLNSGVLRVVRDDRVRA